MQSMFPVWFVSLLLLTIFITLQLQHVVDQSNHCRKLIVPVSVGSKSSHYPHPSLYDYNITQSGADEGFRDMYFAPVLEAYRKVAEKSYAEMPQRRDVSLKEFWKSHFNIADAVFLITSAWKEVTVRCLCAAWRPLWPECVLQRDFEGFEELEEEAVVHEIVSLGNSIGLEVDDDDVEELVEEHSKELSTEELLELHKEENETLKRSLTSEESGEEEDKEESRIIPAKDLKDAFFSWSKLSKLAEDYHPDVGSVQKAISVFNDNVMNYFWKVTSADAVLIHLLSVKSAEKLSEELGTRDQSQPWIMFEPETHFKGNVMFRNDYKLLNGVFNRTMHYRRDSDILMLHGFVVRRGRDASLLPPTWRRQPELHQINNTQKLAVAFISNCKDKSGRLEYIEALKKYAPIDVYGKCGELKCGHSLFTNEGYRIDLEPCMKYAGHHYLFFLAFENALCKDYVSEKLYNLLYYPMVPVVLGGADYSALLPPNSYINAQEYSPQQLAEKLQHLANHPKEYQTYLTWRHYYQPSTVGGSRVLCDLCVRLYDQDLYSHKVIDDFYDWYVKQSNCSANGKV
ncbi:Alpha-(1 3)-fucosyltransferase C-like 4 [Homarus americanus]|uniref:Fucosyltransferase n=1 Tax=Homarus americanus TaxID=6706 RepID=A0A8J5MN85_HOMAM|nr:Alpha-(1 3)-fucosyltransferase C-like 4 [Homarus americanus]